MIIAVFQIFALNPPRNLDAEAGDEQVNLTWDEPITSGNFEIFYHDGTPSSAFFQLFDQGYGTIFDLTDYSGATLEYIDFRHSSWDNPGTYNYNIHVVNWDTQESIAIIEDNVTTVNDDWETEISLGSLESVENVGIFIEPLGNDPEDAYPVIDFDGSLDAQSYVVDVSDYSIQDTDDIGDFLIDLWVNVPEAGLMKLSHQNKVKYPYMDINSDNNIRATLVDYENSENPHHRDLLGYIVYRDEVAITDTIAALSYLDEGLQNGVTYSYYVTAVYNDGESNPSNVVEATPEEPSEVIFYEGFESGNLDDWTLIDNDGDGFNWELGSTSDNGVPPYEGEYCVFSASYDSDSGTALTPDNYLISPQIELEEETTLSFWVAPQDNNYPSDHYEVWVSTTTAEDPDQFTDLIYEETLSPGDWHQVTVNLSDYVDESIYLAWRHCECSDMFIMKIDEISIYSGTSTYEEELSSPKTMVSNYPNPFNPQTNIVYNLPESGRVKITIHDIKGRKIKTLVNETKNAGRNSIIWKGKDDSGKVVSSGVYFYKVKTKNQTINKKMLLLK